MVYPLRKATTREVLNTIDDYSKHYGFPVVLTNNGTQFTSGTWKKIYGGKEDTMYLYIPLPPSK